MVGESFQHTLIISSEALEVMGGGASTASVLTTTCVGPSLYLVVRCCILLYFVVRCCTLLYMVCCWMLLVVASFVVVCCVLFVFRALWWMSVRVHIQIPSFFLEFSFY